MAIAIRKITLWRTEVENRPGTLAQIVRPLADSDISLHVLMGYRIPAQENRAVIELFPISGKKANAAARDAGLEPSSIPTLFVTGDDRPGLGSATAEEIANAGINMSFMVAQVLGRKFTAVYGFETEDDARKATTLIKRAARPRKKGSKRTR
jgi:hypothetical protein